MSAHDGDGGEGGAAADELESVDQLVALFASGEKPESEWRIGTEHEKIGVDTRTHARIPYEGPRGIVAILERLADAGGWERGYEGEHLVALKRDGASVTLEPGGQLELSGAPLRTLRETCSEFNGHVDELKRVSDEFGIAWLALGIDPIHGIEEIPKLPKVRYDIMREYLPTRGTLGLHMMHATATVQANFDYADEADMVAKLRCAYASSPVVSALYANSAISEGKENGFASRRVEIWRHTDPDRCGILHFVFDDPEFGYRRYAEWALDVPMFFVVRDGHYAPAGGITFREFFERGFEFPAGLGPLGGQRLRATRADWDLHLTTVFPEVRLKRFIEVRGADAAPPALICALPALWKGILYDADAMEAAAALTRIDDAALREAALRDVAQQGLAAVFAGRPMLEVAGELVGIASEGLRRIAERGEAPGDERSFLEPVVELVQRGLSPAQQTLEAWRGEWGASLDRLIEHSSY